MSLAVLITGGTGFVGANLAAALNARGIRPRILHRATSSLQALAGVDFDSVEGDIMGDQAQLTAAMRGCDWVFHAAAVADYWRQGADRVYRVNVQGTQNVLAAAQAAGVRRFVFTSSLAALGVPGPGHVLTEADQFNLSPDAWPYGHSKHVAEGYVRAANNASMQTVIVNPTVILGPRDVNQISGSIITEAARGKLVFLLPGGVNFVAVEDVAAGHIAAAEKGRPGERYILGGENLTYRQAIPIICRIVGRPAPRLAIPGWAIPLAAWGVEGARLVLGNRVPLDAGQVRLARALVYADVSKARQELDLPQTPFADMVQRTFAWYRAQGYLT